MDKKIEADLNDRHKIVTERLTKWKEDFAQLQRLNEKNINDHKLKLASIHDTLGKHKE